MDELAEIERIVRGVLRDGAVTFAEVCHALSVESDDREAMLAVKTALRRIRERQQSLFSVEASNG